MALDNEGSGYGSPSPPGPESRAKSSAEGGYNTSGGTDSGGASIFGGSCVTSFIACATSIDSAGVNRA